MKISTADLGEMEDDQGIKDWTNWVPIVCVSRGPVVQLNIVGKLWATELASGDHC